MRPFNFRDLRMSHFNCCTCINEVKGVSINIFSLSRLFTTVWRLFIIRPRVSVRKSFVLIWYFCVKTCIHDQFYQRKEQIHPEWTVVGFPAWCLFSWSVPRERERDIKAMTQCNCAGTSYRPQITHKTDLETHGNQNHFKANANHL